MPLPNSGQIEDCKREQISTIPKSSIIVQLKNNRPRNSSSLFEDDVEEEDEEDVADYLNRPIERKLSGANESPVKALSEHDYFEDYDNNEEPAQIGASELIGEDDGSDEQSYEYYCAKSNAEKYQQKVRRNRNQSEMSEGASRIINLAFERAVRQAIENRSAVPSTYRGRRGRGEDPMSISKEELKQRLDETARELRPLMTTGMISHNDSHGLTHSRALWLQLKADKKLLANIFWEARQQATTSQPAPAYARYTLVALFAAWEGLTYPQAAFRCSISYTTAIEYIALCEVRHYFGEQIAKEIHEFTMQQIDADDPNCMRAWSNNCAKFLNDHRCQRETKKNADLSRSSDNRLYIHLKGDKRPFRVQKLQNFFLRQSATDRQAATEENRTNIIVPDDGSAQPAPKKRRRSTKKPRISLVDYSDAVEQEEGHYGEILEDESTDIQTRSKRQKTLRKLHTEKTPFDLDLAKFSLPSFEPPTPWAASKDPFFLKSVTAMMRCPEDMKKASNILVALSGKINYNNLNTNTLRKMLLDMEQDEDDSVY